MAEERKRERGAKISGGSLILPLLAARRVPPPPAPPRRPLPTEADEGENDSADSLAHFTYSWHSNDDNDNNGDHNFISKIDSNEPYPRTGAIGSQHDGLIKRAFRRMMGDTWRGMLLENVGLRLRK
ncbi:hypothetical protein KM043_017823 [Ampulex compressa]|nr:hypothetical protein KM043_017823 [Ampulex compressa]